LPGYDKSIRVIAIDRISFILSVLMLKYIKISQKSTACLEESVCIA
jgi:hypothetical protein